jgi:hypothetical protein
MKVERLLILCGSFCLAFGVITLVAIHFRYLPAGGWGPGPYFALASAVLGCVFLTLGLTFERRNAKRGWPDE